MKLFNVHPLVFVLLIIFASCTTENDPKLEALDPCVSALDAPLIADLTDRAYTRITGEADWSNKMGPDMDIYFFNKAGQLTVMPTGNSQAAPTQYTITSIIQRSTCITALRLLNFDDIGNKEIQYIVLTKNTENDDEGITQVLASYIDEQTYRYMTSYNIYTELKENGFTLDYPQGS